MNEPVIDRALMEALRKADPGPYPKRIPYAAPVRQFLPDPVTAFRWATCAAAGTIVLGGVAMVVKAMGIDYEAPPRGAGELTELRALPMGVGEPQAPPATVEVPAAAVAVTEVASMVEAEPQPEPVALVAQGVDKVTVVPAVYEARHAEPDVGLNVLGMRVAVDLS